MAVRRLIDRFVYGEERLGHQTELINERVHRAMILICGATFALGGSLSLLMMYMVYLAIHVGEPVRPRGGVEADTSTTEPATFGSGLPSHRATTLPPVCLQELVFHKCLVNESFPSTPRLEESKGDGGDQKSSGRPWYFLRAAAACLEWTPETFCLNASRAHFGSLEECLGDCERGGIPKPRCTHRLRAPLASNCTSSKEPEEEGASRWWFYDPLAQACRDWADVCVQPAFVSYRDCAKRCKPGRSVRT